MSSPRLLACLFSTCLVLAAPAAASAASADPTANRELSQSTLVACQSDPSSADCVTDALADINSARAAEGVAPMVLPSDFTSLGGASQLLVLADLERVARGLIPALGLATPLDSDAAAAAAADEDPQPSHFYGDAFASNWAGGFPSTLEASFAWMYDDGPGSGNLDCTAPGQPGCWGHRHDILMNFDSPLVMGAAVGTGSYGTSMAEVFVGGDQKAGAGEADAPVAALWSTIAGQLPAGASGAVASTTPGTASTPGQPTDRGPVGRSAAVSRLTAALSPTAIRRGAVARLAGRVSPAASGRRVELELRGSRGWTVIATTRLDSRSSFSFRLHCRRSGTLHLRIELPGATRFLAPSLVLRVRR